MDKLEETKQLLKKYKIRANKSLGQNFLIEEKVIEQIIQGSEITKNDLVIEIGPGLGTLTSELIQRAKKVIAIELDPKMIAILQDRFGQEENFEIIFQDVLKCDLHQIVKREQEKINYSAIKVVANLPYYITTPIMMTLLEEKLPLTSITVMIQKEVAERLIAIPGTKNAGAITYSIYYYAKSHKILEVPNSCFIPEPEVTSEVIQLQIRKEPAVKTKEPKVMFAIIKSAFRQRRKTLLNALVNTKVFADKTEAMKLFHQLGIEEKARPEEISIETYAKMADFILS